MLCGLVVGGFGCGRGESGIFFFYVIKWGEVVSGGLILEGVIFA